MTLTEDLKKLQKLDPETFGTIYITLANFVYDIRSWEEREEGGKANISVFQPANPMEEIVYAGIIQGEIQRAISARKWHWKVEQGSDTCSGAIAIINDQNYIRFKEFDYDKSAVGAILKAYIRALEATQ